MRDIDCEEAATTFVVECFWPGATGDSVRIATERLRSTCDRLTSSGSAVAWRGATFVPGDEALSCRFDGTEAAIRSVFGLAGVPYDRVMATLDIPEPSGSEVAAGVGLAIVEGTRSAQPAAAASSAIFTEQINIAEDITTLNTNIPIAAFNVHNSGAGDGLIGSSSGGVGVHGQGAGVEAASSSTAPAVRATGSGAGTGLALDVLGKSKFNRSGVIAITGTAKSAVVTVPGNVTPASLVFAVLKTDQPKIWVASAVPNAPAGKVTITLNTPPGPGNTVKVAWIVHN